ncbi:hypothetical protein IM538_08555 [Cytobacillus suaedae]|nr:hypothetical protein IM538_08555 [Cytobacillus suaedae]
MYVNQLNTMITNKDNNGTGYKVVEVNVKDSSQNLYAVVTPVKLKD